MIVYQWYVVVFSPLFGCVLSLNPMEVSALKELHLKWNVSGWSGEPSCSTWSQHLTCNEYMNVISLDIGFAKPNLLSGGIPEAICNLTYLQELKLYGNRLSGEIPHCVGSLVDMRYLDLSGNCLGGEIPESLGNLTQLEYFDLSVNHHNEFSFSHRELCHKSLLNNGLRGTIPSSLGTLNKVKYFYLSGNLLTGQIPESLGDLTNAMYIYINANNLTGSLPKSIGRLQNLQDLQLSRNNLSGAIPREIGNCSSLRIIQMNRNQITGEIPDTIGNLAQLQALELVHNKLQGNIPEFKTTPVLDLNLLDLRYNNLTGALPKSLGDAPLRYLFLSDNNFLSSNTSDLPEYIQPNYTSRSFVDDDRHFDCPGFTLFSRVFQVTGPVIQLDPGYYNYSLCNCKPGYFGSPPDNCRECLRGGNCLSNSTMTFHIGTYPSLDGEGYIEGFLNCPRLMNGNNLTSACNPNNDCFYGKTGLSSASGKCTLCDANYHGRMCSICSCNTPQDCFYHSHDQCIQCKTIPSKTIVVYSIVFILTLSLFAIFHSSSLVRLLLIIILVSLVLALDSGSWLYLNILVITVILIPATSNGLGSGLVKSLIIYLQTAAPLVKAFPVIDVFLSSVADRLSFSNVNFIGLVCLFPHILGISQHATVNRYILSLSAPAIVFALIVVFLFFKHALLFTCKKVGFNLPNPTSLRVQVSFSLVFIVYFSFFNASSLVISVFTCSHDPSGYEYMTAQHYKSVRCYSDEWWYMRNAAIIGGVVLIFLPLVIFTILLRRHRSRLDEPDVKLWLGYLYCSYKPTNITNTTSKQRERYWCYFEIVYMIIRFSLAVCLSIPIIDSVWIPCVVLVLFIALATIFLKLQPYTRSVDNKAAFASIITLIIMLFAALEINSIDNIMNPSVWFKLIIFVGLNCCTIMMFILLIIWYGRDDLKANIVFLKTSLVYCWNSLRKCKKGNVEDQSPCFQSFEQ